jgi:hypothetical protein
MACARAAAQGACSKAITDVSGQFGTLLHQPQGDRLMTATLQPTVYDALEAAGRGGLPNRVIEAFHPETFSATGYPVHIRDEGELWRYVDVMHETRLEQTVNQVLGGLTDEEFALFGRAVRFMIGFTQAQFGHALRCENALLRAMNIYRYIKALKPSTVMELGPGSGYLGLLLILDGIGYIACENTQAFYLLQNRLWQAAAGVRFLELAEDGRSLREVLSGLPDAAAVHVPWWKVVDLDLANLPGSLDVVTANHCLTEMQPNAMKYYLRMASSLLQPLPGAFVFEGWGSQINHPRGEVAREFSNTGFRLCHADGSVVAYVARAESEQYGHVPLPVSAKHKARNLARNLVGLPTVPYSYFIDRFSGGNRISKIIAGIEATLPNIAVHKYDDVTRFLSKVYGAGVASAEERFLALIGQNYL